MARTPSTTPHEIDKPRLNWLVKQLTEARKLRRAASKDSSHSAVSQLLREERNLRDQIDRARYALAQQAQAETASRPQTAEARAEFLRELVDNASDAELEVAWSEFLRRTRYEVFVDDSGTMHVVPIGESGLRLVKS